jgi:hypothetical protein
MTFGLRFAHLRSTYICIWWFNHEGWCEYHLLCVCIYMSVHICQNRSLVTRNQNKFGGRNKRNHWEKHRMHSVWIVFHAEQKLQVWERLPEHVRTPIFLIIYLLLSITSIASTQLVVWSSFSNVWWHTLHGYLRFCLEILTFGVSTCTIPIYTYFSYLAHAFEFECLKHLFWFGISKVQAIYKQRRLAMYFTTI